MDQLYFARCYFVYFCTSVKMDINGRGEGSKALMPLLFSLVLISGMVLGFNLRDTLRSKRDIASVIERNDRLEQIIDLINEKYVDSVNSDNLYNDAISGILRSLDPHTVYIPAEDLQTANDDLEGTFSGIGVEFLIIRDTIVVTSVIENGPASQAGVETGDQLIKVGDSVVAGVNITSGRIIHLLKGKQKSKVALQLKPYSSPGFRELNITRGLIPVKSVEAGFMIDKTTAYIKVNKFTANTYVEFKDALKQLKKAGATQLIVDLRNNPGGYLSQATSIADEFIDDNKLLVFTEGNHASKIEYKAEKPGLFESGRLAILIDEGSASASEILAGAVQDWDRGVILGKRSFGKGLVQEPYEMTDGSEIRLTIAKYYTPSGRCIQRSFADGKDAYREEFEKRFDSLAMVSDNFQLKDTTHYYTHNHRLVFGGGGIKPDFYVPYDSISLSHTLTTFLTSAELKTEMWDYLLNNKPKFRYKDFLDFDHSFNGEEEVIKDFISRLNAAQRKLFALEMRKPTMAHYFRSYIKAQVARFLFKDNGYFNIIVKDDNVVSRALQVLNSSDYSEAIGGK